MLEDSISGTGTNRSSDDSASIVAEDTVDVLDLVLEEQYRSTIRILFGYRVDDRGETEPLLEVTNTFDTGEYIEPPIDDGLPCSEMSVTEYRDGVIQMCPLSGNGQVADAQTMRSHGVELSIVDINLNGISLEEYTNVLPDQTEIAFEPIGDVHLDEMDASIGTITLAVQYILSEKPLPEVLGDDSVADSMTELAAVEQELVVWPPHDVEAEPKELDMSDEG